MAKKNTSTKTAALALTGELALATGLQSASRQIHTVLCDLAEKAGLGKVLQHPSAQIALRILPSLLLWMIVQWVPLPPKLARRRNALTVAAKAAFMAQAAELIGVVLPAVTTPVFAALTTAAGSLAVDKAVEEEDNEEEEEETT